MQIRNIVLISHQGAGKTSLAESMLFTAGAVQRLGSVDDGTSTSDYDPLEVERQMGINLSLLSFEWNKTKLNLIDAPGYADFVGEVRSGLRVTEGAVVVVCAASGVEVGTEQMWGDADKVALPRLVYVNKMDRDNADFFSTVEGIQSKLSSRCLPVQLPIGSQSDFQGIVDLIDMKAYIGKGMEEAEVPAELKEQAETSRDKLVESAVEIDDELIGKYLEGESISNEEIFSAIRKSTAAGKLVPVLVGSAMQGIGTRPLLDGICSYLPAPNERGAATAKNADSGDQEEIKPDPESPFAGFVFKTSADPYVGKLSYFRIYSGVVASNSQVWNANKNSMERVGQIFTTMGKSQQQLPQVAAGDIGVVARLSVTTTGDTLCAREHPVILEGIDFPHASFSMSIQPETKTDLDKMSTALPRICEEDPSLQTSREHDTGEFLISGIGDTHLEIVREKMRRKFGVAVRLDTPKVPYKETITVPTKAEHKHKKQSGGHGQYGHVMFELEPLERGGGFEFAEKIVGGKIPQNYIPSVEKGVKEARQWGVLGGYPVVDVKVTLYDGSVHPVDSSDMAFKIAAAQALKKGLSQGQPVLIEPIMKLKITVPEAYTGDIMSDLNTKRGRVLGMNPAGGFNVIDAQAPYSELVRYAIDLRSMTQARGEFIMEFDHYEEVPAHLAQKVIDELKRATNGD
ncbi:MAG: elongation factor G [Dehalococcoidia bacterium]